MDTIASPTLSSGGDRKPSSNSTPTMLRAKNTSRRISVWMQQTWRERTIPSADFGHNNNTGSVVSQNRSTTTTTTTNLNSPISSPIGTPMSKRFTTPPSIRIGSPQNNNTTTNNIVVMDPETALVGNVDEAFAAWTSLYKFEDHFPQLNNDNTEEESNNNDDNSVVDTSDWLLDGDEEWEEQCKRSKELLETMYPGNSSNMLSDLITQLGGETENMEDAQNNDLDEESLLLLKFGSPMGQQEYQFASFETADFSNLAQDVKKDDSDPPETIEREKEESEVTEQQTDKPERVETEKEGEVTIADEIATSNNEKQLDQRDSERSTAQITTESHTLATSPPPNGDHNFEAFWQTAMDAATPETGTFPSIGSRSTYVTSPLLDDGLFSPVSNFGHKNTEITLDCIPSQEGDDDDDDESQQNDKEERVMASDALKSAFEDYDSDSDFGDFREAPTPIAQNNSFDEGSRGEEDSAKIDGESSIENDSPHIPSSLPLDQDSASQEKSPIDESAEDVLEEAMDHVNMSFESAATPLGRAITATASSPTFHTGVTPLRRNDRSTTPSTPLQNASPTSAFSASFNASPASTFTPNDEEFETPLSQRLFHTQDDKNTEQNPTNYNSTNRLMSARAMQAADAAAAMEQFTPVTRNFRYWEPKDSDSIESAEQRKSRTLMVNPGKRNPTASPEREFKLEDMNNVMNGIPDEDSDLIEDELDGLNSKKSGEESVTQGGEESLLSGSIQSSSIPSVVQLFTKSVDAERRSKIVVPNTVRATKHQGISLPGASDSLAPTNGGLSMPSFYFGRNQTSKCRPSSEIVSVSASEVASASASIMSMPMMKNVHRHGKTLHSTTSEKMDEPSINSSLASPEVKFLRRNKNAQSKRLIRNRMGGRSSLSIHSRTSRTSDGYDDGTFDDPSQQQGHYGDPRNDFYHYYYGYDDDAADSDCGSDDLTDEESLSLGSLSTLPNEYWKHPELDHTLRELTKLEWDWLPFWQMDRLLDDIDDVSGYNMDNIPLLQDQITQKLSKLDAFYGKICKKVYRKIQPHSDALLSANQAAMDLHQNLQLSQMYLSRSQESIERAKYGRVLENDKNDDNEKGEGVGVHGAVRLLELWDIQHSYHDLCRVEKVISEISELESAISQRIQCFNTYKENSLEDFETIVDMVASIEEKLAADPAKRLVCFDATRERSRSWISEGLVSRLHDCLSEIAVEWCLASDSSDSTLYVADGPAYSRLIEILLRITNSNCGDNGDSTTPNNSVHSDPVMAICTSIQTSLMLEIQKAFGRALLDPTDSETEKSEYEQELAALANNEAYLDANRLPIWTHNLVTIRFEFEMKQGGKQPMPAIFHKLCLLLTNILCGMHRLIEWHNENTSSHDVTDKETKDSFVDCIGISEITKAKIREELKNRRASIWNACIQSIEECLEEYISHSGKKELFSKRDGKHDDYGWQDDLEGLHDISVLYHQFLSIRPHFLEGVSEEVVNDGSKIDETLYSCFKAHLRSFHVEAMNTLGTMFYREDWKVYSLQELRGKRPTSNSDGDDVQSIFESISEQLRYQVGKRQRHCCRSRQNVFASFQPGCLDKNSLLSGEKNPFEIDQGQKNAEAATQNLSPTAISWDDFCSDKRTEPILALLRTYIGASDDSGSMSKIVLKSVFEGVLPWTARLLFTIEKLPALAEEACKVMQSIVDLYVTTAFRLCTGNRRNERILLGIDSIKDMTTSQKDTGNARVHRSTSPPIFDFGLRSKSPHTYSNRPAPVISSTAEAELCALVLEESDGLDRLREFLVTSQKRLEGVAKLDLVDGWIRDPKITEDTIEEDFAEETANVLEKRQAASCNHLFVALGLFLATQGLSSSSSFDMIHSYTRDFLDSIPLLLTLSNRISCMRSIRGKALLREVISVGSIWEESKLHEHANEYVEEFCDFLALLWQSLYAPASGRRLPLGILKTLWENLVGGGYMVLLDGFSKVPYCSTEGRALMSMDVASYRSGTSPRAIAERIEDNNCPLPSDIRPYRTMAYVDTYIKIFYFPSNDALDWIKANYKQYHRHHVISLVMNDRDARKLTNQVMRCYSGNGGAETIRI